MDGTANDISNEPTLLCLISEMVIKSCFDYERLNNVIMYEIKGVTVYSLPSISLCEASGKGTSLLTALIS